MVESENGLLFIVVWQLGVDNAVVYAAEGSIFAMGSVVSNRSTLKVDGGASRNNFLLQFQTDISKQMVIRPSDVESTALGAVFVELGQVLLKGWQQVAEL